MNAPRVLLHLGLPKTATSSLQHNVFQKLHEENRINFLGKCLEQNYKTGKLDVYNYEGKFIRDAAEGKISINEARALLHDKLSLDKLNIFSDEGVMIAYPGECNTPLVKKFENLKKIFDGYDTNVVVTLREPVDYLYSLYVQLYPDFCSKVESVNSVQKYIKVLLCEPNNVLFESFFYKRWLSQLNSYFEVTVFDYEQLFFEDSSLYREWAMLMGLSPEKFRSYFDSKKMNVKPKSGKEVEKVWDLKFIETHFRKFFSRNSAFFKATKWFYKVSGTKALLNYRFSSGVTHQYPDGEEFERLKKLLD